MQEYNYKSQLNLKTKMVKDNLERIGNLKSISVKETIGMDIPYFYRNKAQFQVGINNGKIAIGFYSANSHEVVDITECCIQTEINSEVVKAFREFMEETKISVYDRKTGKGVIRHLVTRTSGVNDELMVCVVINAKDLVQKDLLINKLKNIQAISSIVLNINNKNSSEILSSDMKVIFGKSCIEDSIGDLKFNISPLSFFQVNIKQTKVLYDKIVEFAGLAGNETVIDAYCGIGTIGLYLAKKVKKVIGIELIEEAIKDGKENLVLNNIDNVEFIKGEAEIILPDLLEKGLNPDLIIVDPPRKGCEESLLKSIVDTNIGKVIYVSCDPATLARDLKFMNENGYMIKEVQPVDLFPMTMHVETVVLLVK